MKKLKSNENTVDRLSDLPCSLILEILSLLEMRDVVRTTLLSKRWKYLWTSVPCLKFTEYRRNSVQFRNFVDQALTLWRGTRLRKFSIKFWSPNERASLSSDIDLWVLFAKKRKVEELCISYNLYRPPEYLYECSSIRKLKLFDCNLQIRGNVQWHRLNYLYLSGSSFTEDLIDKVLSSSPQLETLKLDFLDGRQNLSIRSSSLKKLWVSSIDDESSVLTIWAPKLETLTLAEEPYGKYLLTDVSSLTEVYLGFWRNSSASCQISPPLLNVKLLTIDNCLNEPNQLVGVLENFPKLKMLNINWNIKCVGEVFKFNAENYTMSEAKNLQSNLSELRTAQITWYSYEASIFQFIEFLLKHATMIEKIVIRKRGYKVVKLGDMSLAEQKVVSLQRSFPGVELVLRQK